MQLNMKKQVKNIKNFLVMLSTIFLFLLFGKNNLIIGIGTIVIAVSLFMEDYTAKPVKVINQIVFIQILIGVLAYIGSLNYILEFIITFVVIFALYYLFSYDIKPSKSAGFVMTYLLLLYSPVPLSQMPKRLIALAFSGLVVMALYYYFTRYNFQKSINSQILNVSSNIKKEIDQILSLEDIKEINESNSLAIKNIEIKIYDRLENSIKDKSATYNKGIIIGALKSINRNLINVKKTNENKGILIGLKNYIENIELYLKNGIDIDTLKNITEGELVKINSTKVLKGIDKYRFFNFKLILEEMIKFLDNRENILKLYSNEKLKFVKLNRKKAINTSIRWNIAIKAAVMISISTVFVNYFDIFVGKWIPFTMVVIILPYVEQSNKKIIDRMSGTLIGVLISEAVWLLFSDNKIILISIIVISLYLSINIKSYNKRAIFITMTSVLAMVIMYPNISMDKIGVFRVLFSIVAGIIVAVALNLIFPYKITNDTKSTVKEYCDLSNDITSLLVKENWDFKEIDLKLIMNNHYWRRLNYNNMIIKSDKINRLLSTETEFVADICFIFKGSYYLGNKHLYKEFAMKIIEEFKKENTFERVREIFLKSESDKEKTIILSLYRVYRDIDTINKLSMEIKDEIK